MHAAGTSLREVFSGQAVRRGAKKAGVGAALGGIRQSGSGDERWKVVLGSPAGFSCWRRKQVAAGAPPEELVLSQSMDEKQNGSSPLFILRFQTLPWKAIRRQMLHPRANAQ